MADAESAASVIQALREQLKEGYAALDRMAERLTDLEGIDTAKIRHGRSLTRYGLEELNEALDTAARWARLN